MHPVVKKENQSGETCDSPELINDGPKTRHCLRCREAFPSEWRGERICRRCKQSNVWRTA